jgi:Spy/CpxP family protein refolding chaperone
MKKTVLALLLTVVFAVPAFAEMKDMDMRGHREGHEGMSGMCDMCKTGMGRMNGMEMGGMGNMAGMCLEHAKKMGLSDEQIDKIKPVHRTMEKMQARYKADLKIAKIDLMEIMDVKDFDIDKANAAVQKIAAIKTAHQLEMLKSMKEVRGILTDEQFKKMKMMMNTMMMDGKKPGKMMKKHK